ncbi:dTDP-4-dehydrorhamnose 3,5-epimerase [Aureibaculum conchae]|uniref:dTDP-4-dehydrorhamnose 3,5-epimerase n=1 Tax=Aureibaculum sp. 2308TA14-22 TaxID=3108392 RepID=UPI00339524C3
MNKIETSIQGCFELQPRIFKDDRGKLIKTFHKDTFLELGLETDFKEEYYSVSKKNVLRGLHFQTPPEDHVKCVTCISGKIFDAVVDLRKNSSTYKQNFTLELDAEKGNMLYIPKGFAHGFYALTENAIFLNRTTTVYNPNCDTGIKWDSCGIDWPFDNPILSGKDEQMVKLENYSSPF